MKKLIPVLILSLIACGKKENTQNWKAPNVYWIRSSELLTSNHLIKPTDAIYFTEEQHSSAERLKSDSKVYNIQSKSTCVLDGKTYEEKSEFTKNNVLLKEVLPIPSLEKSESICEIQITLKNSGGSTKTYTFKDKKIDTTGFKFDFDFNKTISVDALSTTYINGHKKDDIVRLNCESFTTQLQAADSQAISLDSLSSQNEAQHKDIKVTDYKPHQKCFITSVNSTQKLISNKFEIRYEKLMPKYSYEILSNRSGGRLYLYNLSVINHHPVPVSVGLHKPSMVVPLSHETVSGSREADGISRYHRYNSQASYSTSGKAKVLDKGENLVIYILPGEDFMMQAYADVGECKSKSCVHSKVSDGNLPIFNLEYNYRSIEEIENAQSVQILDRLEAN